MNNIHQWAEQAVSHIRPRDEREAAREELMAHFEDHRDALIERGLSRQLAEAEALRAMGDPEETGQLLKVTHSPWPNWVWKVSRWVLAIALIALVMVFGSEIRTAVLQYYSTVNLKETLAEFDEEDPYRDKQELSCDARAQAGDYALSVYRVQRVHFNNGDGYTSDYIRVILEARAPVMLDSPQVLAHSMEARDSRGTELVNLFEHADEGRTHYMNGAVIGRKWRSHYIALNLFHYDPEADWIDLIYDRCGVQFSMRLDLKGGGGS